MHQNIFSSIYLIPSLSIGVFILFILLYLVFKYNKELHKKDLLLIEQEEKIKYLRQISAKNEDKNTADTHKREKEIIELEHTIERLETKIKEGTKNQVVAMLEAQKKKRVKALNQVEISE